MISRFLVSAVPLAFLTMVPLAGHAAVLANIGGKTIESNDLKTDYEAITGDQRKAINEDFVTRHNIVENAINAEVAYDAAKKAGLDKDEDYRKAVDRFQRQYLVNKFLEKAVEPRLTKNDVKKFFEQNKTFFDSTEVCAHHIVVGDEELAKKLAAQAKAKGAKFEELAKEHSLDPTVQENKGNLGCFTRDRMVPEFSAAAFDMHKHEVRGPVRTIYGYHVIRIDDIRPGKQPGFDEVEQRVKETYRLKLVTEVLSDLRGKAGVKVNEEEVRKLKL